MITKIAEKVWKIKTNFLDANVYLIDLDEPTLIDLGYHTDNKVVLTDLDSIGYSPKDVKRVIFTHLHSDHSGKPSDFPNARFYASYQEIKNLKSMQMFFTYDAQATEFLNKTKLEPLREKIGPFEVIQTPGHTSGSVCLYLKENNLLFTGDTLFGKHTGRTDVPTGSDKEMDQSLKKLARFKAKLLPGHDYG
ncbi:MAG: MBL fold metallo-hydrolase [archaeon]